MRTYIKMGIECNECHREIMEILNIEKLDCDNRNNIGNWCALRWLKWVLYKNKPRGNKMVPKRKVVHSVEKEWWAVTVNVCYQS